MRVRNAGALCRKWILVAAVLAVNSGICRGELSFVQAGPNTLRAGSFAIEPVHCVIPLQGVQPNSGNPRSVIRESFKDRTAFAISPTAVGLNNGREYCVSLAPRSRGVVYSSFTTSQNDEFSVELMADDAATLTISDIADVPHVVYTMRVASFGYGIQYLTLPAGRYSIEMEMYDSWTDGSSVAMSIAKGDGTVIKHTSNDGSWLGTIVPAR